MHGGQGWPAMPLVSCQHEAMAAPTCASARRKPAGHGPRPLYLIRGREGINRGQSSNTWKQQQLDYIEHNNSLVTISCILHIIWI